MSIHQDPAVRQLIAPQWNRRLEAAEGGDRSAAAAISRTLNAAQYYERVIELTTEHLGGGEGDADAGDLRYELLFALARGELRQLGERVREAQRLQRKFKEAAWAHRNMALIYYYTEDDAKARKSLGRALELSPKDERTLEVQALIHAADDDPEARVKALKKMVRAASRNFRLRLSLGHAHLDLGQLDEARDCYLRSLKLEPLYVGGWHAMGSLLIKGDRDYVSAVQCFSRALSINPRSWDVYFALTDHYVEERQYELAKAEASRVLLLDPDSSIKAEVENHLGFIDYTLGNYEDAVKRYRRAITLDPEFDSPWHNLGLVHVHEKDYRSAIECFERAIKLNEDRSWSYTQLGLATFEIKDFDRAEKLFRTALEKNPLEYGAYVGLAELYRKEKKHTEQLEACLAALEVEPNDGNVRNYLGIAYECNGRPEEAIAQYQEALRLDPLNRWAANNLGYLYEKLHQESKKKVYQDKAVSAWRVRLLICRDTQTSTAGSKRHLMKLGVTEATFERWLRDGRLESELEKIL